MAHTAAELERLFEQEQNWCNLVDSWQRKVMKDSDYGYLVAEFTNSIYGAFQYESGHYGYSRRKHRRLIERFDLDYNNACLIRYTVRQFDYADGPSSDIHSFIGAGLEQRGGYRYLGTTSNDERGTYLTYWYIKEFTEPVENPSYNPDDDEYDEEEFDYDEYEYDY